MATNVDFSDTDSKCILGTKQFDINISNRGTEDEEIEAHYIGDW